MKLKIEIPVSVVTLADVLELAQVSANYWANFGDTEPDKGPTLFADEELSRLSEYWAKGVLSGTQKIKILDTEDDAEVHGYLSAEMVSTGVERFVAKFPQMALNMFQEEDYDAESADVFLQICMFDEIVFS